MQTMSNPTVIPLEQEINPHYTQSISPFLTLLSKLLQSDVEELWWEVHMRGSMGWEEDSQTAIQLRFQRLSTHQSITKLLQITQVIRPKISKHLLKRIANL